MKKSYPWPDLYCAKIPDFLRPFAAAAPMVRLKNIGMNCGCEYTSFPRFRGLPAYSRYRHSLGAALIVWNFTEDPVQTLAALFHDIATPVFAHSVDFLHKDYLRQESTEEKTGEIIRSSVEICALLAKENISPDDVSDYHRYPIADNDSPRLSSDRLEYTLGNLQGYGFAEPSVLRQYYDDICVSAAEDGQQELCFRTEEIAFRFAADALKCSEVYVSDEDRYSMQILSELLALAIEKGVIHEADLMLTEPEVIGKFGKDPGISVAWKNFTALHAITKDESVPDERKRVIYAKKRAIDPFVAGKGRVSGLYPEFRKSLQSFLAGSQDYWVSGI